MRGREKVGRIAGTLTILAVIAVVSACSQPAVPRASDVSGTWVGFDSMPVAAIDLLDGGTCMVTTLPPEIVSGPETSDAPITEECTWRIGSATGETRDEDGMPFLTLDLASGGRLLLTVLFGPRLSARVGDDGQYLDFDRGQA